MVDLEAELGYGRESESARFGDDLLLLHRKRRDGQLQVAGGPHDPVQEGLVLPGRRGRSGVPEHGIPALPSIQRPRNVRQLTPTTTSTGGVVGPFGGLGVAGAALGNRRHAGGVSRAAAAFSRPARC